MSNHGLHEMCHARKYPCTILCCVINCVKTEMQSFFLPYCMCLLYNVNTCILLYYGEFCELHNRCKTVNCCQLFAPRFQIC